MSKTKRDQMTVAEKLARCEEEIAAAEARMKAAALDAALSDDPHAGFDVTSEIAALRSRREVLQHALAAACEAEHRRAIEAQAKEIASKRRAAVQHLARMERHFAEMVEHAAQAQAAFAKAAEARQAAELLLPPRGSGDYAPVHDDLSYHRLRNLARLAAYSAGIGSPYPLTERGDVTGVGGYEDANGALRPMQEVLGEIVASAKQALNPQPTEPQHGPLPGGLERVAEGSPEPIVHSLSSAPGDGEPDPASDKPDDAVDAGDATPTTAAR
jgi:hypothetical protein